MTKIEYIEIPQELSIEIERRFYEYNAALSVVRFLMSQSDINEDMLQKYLDSVEYKYIELELMKKSVTDKYPSKIGNTSYEIDFDNYCIKYYDSQGYMK